jgi:chemotaxis protein MotA
MTDLIGHVLTPLPILIVTLGAGLIALMQTGRGAAAGAFAAFRPLLRARPEDERDAARALLFKVEAIAELKGLARTDRLQATHPFIAQALNSLANASDVEHFAVWINQALDDRRARHSRVITFWNAIADAAPAMGMAGTIIGLIGMFARMSDPFSIGPSMALALMTTLHGMILANAIAGPIANRLADLSQRELGWQQAFADRLVAIAAREPGMLRRPGAREAA